VQTGHRDDGRVVDHAHARLYVKDLVDHRPDLFLILIGDTEQRGDDRRGQNGPELLDIIPGGFASPFIEQADAEFSDAAFELCNSPRRERLRDQATEAGVVRGIEEDHHPVAAELIVRHDLQHGPVGRAEQFRVTMGGVDVGEAAQCPKVVTLVVVRRSLVA